MPLGMPPCPWATKSTVTSQREPAFRAGFGGVPAARQLQRDSNLNAVAKEQYPWQAFRGAGS